MRRLLPALVGVVIVVGGIVILMSVFSGKDASQLDASPTAQGPGIFEEQPGDPPSSGATDGPNLTQEGEVDDATLVKALSLGDVALVYGTKEPPAALVQLRDDLTGPFDPELAAAGQMAFFVRRPGTEGIVALAWQRRLEAPDPTEPAIKAFVEHWVGVKPDLD